MSAEIIQSLKKLPHKQGVNSQDWDRVHSNLLILANFFVQYCLENNLPILFTSIIRPMIEGVSTTDIHAQKRAFDTSVSGWPMSKILECVDECNKRFEIGALSFRDRKEREVIYENGKGGAHLHWQVRA